MYAKLEDLNSIFHNMHNITKDKFAMKRTYYQEIKSNNTTPSGRFVTYDFFITKKKSNFSIKCTDYLLKNKEDLEKIDDLMRNKIDYKFVHKGKIKRNKVTGDTLPDKYFAYPVKWFHINSSVKLCGDIFIKVPTGNIYGFPPSQQSEDCQPNKNFDNKLKRLTTKLIKDIFIK